MICCCLGYHYPYFYIQGGQGYKERTELVPIMTPIGTLSLTCLIYKSYVQAPTDRVMLPWAARFGHFESSIRWAESLWALPLAI
jgi:hypothetical protein